MLFNTTRRTLERVDVRRAELARRNADPKARIAELEAERTPLDGAFRNLGAFGDSLGGVRQSFARELHHAEQMETALQALAPMAEAYMTVMGGIAQMRVQTHGAGGRG